LKENKGIINSCPGVRLLIWLNSEISHSFAGSFKYSEAREERVSLTVAVTITKLSLMGISDICDGTGYPWRRRKTITGTIEK